MRLTSCGWGLSVAIAMLFSGCGLTGPDRALTLYGVIFSTSERPLAGAVVEVLDGVSVVGSSTANAVGNYTVSGLSAGTRTLRVSAAGYSTESVSVTIDRSLSRNVVLSLTAAEKSNRYDALFFDKGPYGGTGTCHDWVNRKLVWGGREVEVVFSPRASDAQRASLLTPLSQFGAIAGKISVTVSTRDLDFVRDYPKSGQFLVFVENDIAKACRELRDVQVNGCTLVATTAAHISFASIVLAPDAVVGAHDMLHLLTGACDVRATGPFFDETSIGGGSQTEWTREDVDLLTEAWKRGVLRPLVVRDDYVRAGLIQ